MKEHRAQAIFLSLILLLSACGSGSFAPGVSTLSRSLETITITPANPDLVLGTVQQFTATATYSDKSVQDITDSVTWSSSNDGLASIDGGGLAAALALGSLTISATDNSVSGTTTVNVQSAVLTSIKIRPANGKIAQSTSQQFRAVGIFSDGSTHSLTGKVSWSSSNTSVATINKGGLARGLTPGTTTIAATIGSMTSSTTFRVTDATIASITVKPSGRTIAPATRLSFTAVGRFSDNSTQVITTESTWSTDNLAVATMRAGASAIGVGPGTANVIATLNGVAGSAPLNVSSATLTSISITPSSAVLALGTFVNCIATGTFSDGSTQVITGSVTWTSSESAVASVAGGRVNAETGGSAVITAQLGSVTAGSTITVDSSQLVSIQISPATASVAQQNGVAFQAIGKFADGNTQDLTTFAGWTSSQPSVATVTLGHATGIQAGTATIVALFDGQVGTASLTVAGATATSSGVSAVQSQ